MAHGLTRKFLSYLNKKKGSANEIRVATVATDEFGIKVNTGSGWGPLIAWNQITRIVAFKRDVYSHDLICLLIETDDAGVLELNENMPGWAELVKELEIRLPSAKPHTEWFAEVAFPAFAVTPTEVFVRR